MIYTFTGRKRGKIRSWLSWFQFCLGRTWDADIHIYWGDIVFAWGFAWMMVD